MIAQAYNKGELRILDRSGRMIAEVRLKASLKSCADVALRRLRMRRREKWQDCSWGSEAKIRFME